MYHLVDSIIRQQETPIYLDLLHLKILMKKQVKTVLDYQISIIKLIYPKYKQERAMLTNLKSKIVQIPITIILPIKIS